MITVIGGSGFVGSFLLEKLKTQNILNIDKNQSPFFKKITKIIDIRDQENLILSKDCSTVILLAAEHRDDVSPTSLYYDVNVQGTLNVLKAMDKAGIKNIIFTSSVAVYGLNKTNPDENHPCEPFNHYGKSKLQAELCLKKWFDKNPLNKSVTIIRPTVIFGERNRGNVYNLLKQISSGRFLMIGQGKNKKSMAYVGNIVSFIINRIENKEKGYRIFNYADKPDLTMTELVKLIEKKMKIKVPNVKIPYLIGMLGGCFFDLVSIIFKKKLPISSVRVKKFCATTQFNSNKSFSVFNPPFKLKDGLYQTLDHEFLNQKKDDIIFYSE